LDGVTRNLDPDITCIIDGNADEPDANTAAAGRGRTIALAGVMGGLDTEVTETTVDILLESATFSPAHTSRTSRRLQLFSESSARYERGADAELCDFASARAAALMVEVAGGSIAQGLVDAYPDPVQLPTLTLSMRRMNDLIGADIALEEAAAILRRLGCMVSLKSADGGGVVGAGAADAPGTGTDAAAATVATPTSTAAATTVAALTSPSADTENAAWLEVQPPSFRPDLTREIDLVEEVLRIWGMERVQPTLPGGRERIGSLSLDEQRVLTIERTLRGCGLNETMTYSFASAEDTEKLQMSFEANQEAAELLNPMNADQAFLRRSILPGLLKSVAYNLSRGVANIQLYELGSIFFAAEGRKVPRELRRLSAVLAGSLEQGSWSRAAQDVDFFDLKGILDCLLRELNVQKIRYKTVEDGDMPWLQSGKAAILIAGNQEIGWLGEIDPRAATSFDIDVPVFAFDLDIKALLKVCEFARPFMEIPQYPPVQRDLAIVVDADLSSERLEQVIRSAGGSLLCALQVFDVYVDAQRLGAGKKSVAFSLSYQALDRTLTSEEVDKAHERLLSKLVKATGGELRS
jgi:phenylalanyl-tRNA synthetase beta chain